MQAALPVTVADRVASWRRPLEKHLASLDHLGEQVEVLQFAGPVGLRDKPEGVADRVARLMAEDLDLVYTQTAGTRIVTTSSYTVSSSRDFRARLARWGRTLP